MTTVVKMVGKRVEIIEKIRAYVKVHTKLGHSEKQLSHSTEHIFFY